LSWSQRPARVRAPASSANLGPGFDALGLALGRYDEVEARITAAGLVIEVSGEGTATAAAGEQHLVVRAMRAAFGAMGGQPPGIALHCANTIPQGRGLGSSAAAICCGLLAARALASGDEPVVPGEYEVSGEPVVAGEHRVPGEHEVPGEPGLSDEAVFQLATELDGHADNVAACLSGGLTIAWTPRPGPVGAAGPGPRLLRVPVSTTLRAVVCVPPWSLATAAARQAVPRAVPHADASANAARTALLVAALTGAPHVAPQVLFDATEDLLHQPYRAGIMPETADLLSRLRRAGAAAVVSGSGPAVLVFSFAGQPPSAQAVDSIARETGIAWGVTPLDIDQQGAHVQQGGAGRASASQRAALTIGEPGSGAG
jgi:homoserine kinase